jgi:hypothetical protein
MPAGGGLQDRAVHAAATLVGSVIVWLVGLGAIVLMFSSESAPFYRQQAGA